MHINRNGRGIAGMVAAAAVCFGLGAEARTLKIGLSAEPVALDPHFMNLTPNNQLTSHIFDALLNTTPEIEVKPGLAESYRALDDTTWEFKLRKGVKFHDGSAFDANDVVFSFCRVPQVLKSPSPFTLYTKSIAAMEAVDPHTLRITTRGPYPMLPRELVTIGIISAGLINDEKVKYSPEGCKIASAWPATADFNNGKHAIGTGPFKYAEYVKGDHILLRRNEAYWREKADWEAVRFQPITNAGSRVAALLSDDVDLIENPLIDDIPQIERSGKYKIARDLSVRLIYLGMDHRAGEVPQGVAGTNGKNPFQDERVRKALSLAIDRQTIVSKIMNGYAEPAEQLLGKRFYGANPDLPALGHDPQLAKKLLAEAGYPNGFEITLAAPNDRYVNDAQIAQAVAQMWTRIGVKTKVDAMTSSVFFPKTNKGEFGIWLSGWGPRTGEVSSPLRSIVATPDREKGWGSANPGKYSDPGFDATLESALNTMNDSKRLALLHAASKRAIEKFVALPVHYEVTPWALRKDLEYKARADQLTLAHEVKAAKR